MSAVHLWLAWIVGGTGIGVALIAALGWIRPPLDRRLLDRAILFSLGGVIVSIGTGLVLLLRGGRPTDVLHFLYAAIALGTLPVARAWGGPTAGRRPGLIVVGGIVLIAVTVRLAQTGS